MGMTEPTYIEIIAARDKCAEIIIHYGDQYLPIFERLEEEIRIRAQKIELLKKAHKIGTQSGTQNGTQLKSHFIYAS
jgi:hypothetical protein